MVKNTKKPKMTGSKADSRKTTEQQTVANVNNSPAKVRTRSRSKVNDRKRFGSNALPPPNKRKADKHIAFDEMQVNEADPRQTQAKNKPTSKRVAGRNSQNSSATVEAQFLEGDQLMSMKVTDVEDSLYCTESSADEADSEKDNSDQEDKEDENEIDFPGLDKSRDTQSDDNSEATEDTPATVQTPPCSRASSTQARIKEIDDEMKGKLMELHDLMLKGGLTESVEVLENCMKITTGKDSQNQTNSAKRKKGERLESNNINDNHSQGREKSMESQSEETIYRNAIAKCISSSSDEIDTSDEMLHIPSFDSGNEDDKYERRRVVRPPLPPVREGLSTSGYQQPRQARRAESPETPDEQAQQANR